MSLICPKCGFRDSPCWRTSKFRRYSLISKIDELEGFEPEVAKQVREENGQWVWISPYWYILSLKSGIVNRTTPGMGLDEWKTHGFTEHPKPAPDPKQRILFSEGFSSQEKSSG